MEIPVWKVSEQHRAGPRRTVWQPGDAGVEQCNGSHRSDEVFPRWRHPGGCVRVNETCSALEGFRFWGQGGTTDTSNLRKKINLVNALDQDLELTGCGYSHQ